MILPAAFLKEWGRLFLTIVAPALTGVSLLLLTIYFYIIPSFENTYVDGKKEMIRELTKAAWNVIEYYHAAEQAGKMSRRDAQTEALMAMETLRYGENDRDYFWVTDSRPSLIMHPYSKELLGIDLNDYQDKNGKKVFVEIRRTVEVSGSGFIDYSWNKKYQQEISAPKLSYVKLYKPWDWVVGTGVFLDDVEEKTRRISRRLSLLSLSMVAVLLLILLYVGRRSYIFEKQRNGAFREVEQSRIKYKNLVETATEAILLFLDQKCIYSNQAARSVLRFSEAELYGIHPSRLFIEKENNTFIYDGHSLKQGQFDVTLRARNGDQKDLQLTVFAMNMGNQLVSAVSFRDISGIKKVEKALGESQEKYRQLVSRLNIGVFRASVEGDMLVVEGNQAFFSLLGDTEENKDIYLLKTLSGENMNEIHSALLDQGYVKNAKVKINNDSENIDVHLSLVLGRDSSGAPLYCDGILEDISEEARREEAREQLIIDLRTSERFLGQPLLEAALSTRSCEMFTSVSEAAALMKAESCTSLLVRGAAGQPLGIVTETDFVKKMVPERLDYDTPVSAIMTSPPHCIDQNNTLFDAIIFMQEKGIRHLAVTGDDRAAIGVVSSDTLFSLQRYSSSFLISEIAGANDVASISVSMERTGRIIQSLVDSGAHARNITRVTGRISETVIARCLELSIKEIGPPPVSFAFISLGSEGRGEQTLATDQDNAIIYSGIDDSRCDDVARYFNTLATRACTMLDEAGYNFCKGEIMAMNTKWCQPLSVWMDYFSGWIADARPQDLLEVSIFFDFRCAYGDEQIVEQLRRHISQAVSHRDAFFYQLAQNALLFKLPVDFFGNIAPDSSGEHEGTFNIKHVIALIVGYARLYAINFGLKETNTLLRLDRLKEKSFISHEMHDTVSEAYNYLMQVRFKHQVKMLENGREPDNHIPVDELSLMEKAILKKIFSQVGELQSKLNAIGKVEIFF